MQLRDYLTKHSLTQHAFGLLMNPPVSQGKVNHWLQGTRRVSLSEALQIQQVTGGEVTVEELAQNGAKGRRAAGSAVGGAAVAACAEVAHV